MKRGYERTTLLTFKDKENNMPLHAAVNGGNIKVGATGTLCVCMCVMCVCVCVCACMRLCVHRQKGSQSIGLYVCVVVVGRLVDRCKQHYDNMTGN